MKKILLGLTIAFTAPYNYSTNDNWGITYFSYLLPGIATISLCTLGTIFFKMSHPNNQINADEFLFQKNQLCNNLQERMQRVIDSTNASRSNAPHIPAPIPQKKLTPGEFTDLLTKIRKEEATKAKKNLYIGAGCFFSAGLIGVLSHRIIKNL